MDGIGNGMESAPFPGKTGFSTLTCEVPMNHQGAVTAEKDFGLDTILSSVALMILIIAFVR